MKIALIREGKIPADSRVVLSPEQAADVQKKFPGIQVICQSSAIRCFTDEQYREQGIEVVKDISDCDILLGVKESFLLDRSKEHTSIGQYGSVLIKRLLRQTLKIKLPVNF